MRTAHGAYDANTANMIAQDPALDWGGSLYTVVGDAVTPGDSETVCLAEADPSGSTYDIAKVATGPNAGTYYGTAAGCPANDQSGANLRALGFGWADQATQNDLTRGLTDADHVRADHGSYDSADVDMMAVDPALDWGGRITFVVGDAVSASDMATVCLSEESPTGRVFEIAEVAAGANAGTYYGKSAGGCPAPDGNGANLKALGTSW